MKLKSVNVEENGLEGEVKNTKCRCGVINTSPLCNTGETCTLNDNQCTTPKTKRTTPTKPSSKKNSNICQRKI